MNEARWSRTIQYSGGDVYKRQAQQGVTWAFQFYVELARVTFALHKCIAPNNPLIVDLARFNFDNVTGEFDVRNSIEYTIVEPPLDFPGRVDRPTLVGRHIACVRCV